MTRILVVQTAFLGDVVLTTPLLRELKRSHPEAQLTVVANPVGAAVLGGLAHVDEIVSFDKRGAQSGSLGTARLAFELRRGGFDLAVAAQRSARTGMLVWASGARTRIGFEGASGAFACNRRVPWSSELHAVRRYLALARPAGGDPDHADPAPELAITPQGRQAAADALARASVPASEARIAIAPGSIWGTKRWSPDGFAALARGVRDRGFQALLVGSPAERALCGEVQMLSGGAAVVLAGDLPIPGLTALLAGSRALVTNDSGSGHVASAVRTPVVSIFGPTVPAFGYTPWGDRNRIVEHEGLECRPCHAHGPQVCPLGHHHCMTEIAPGQVLAALDRILSAAERAPGTPGAPA